MFGIPRTVVEERKKAFPPGARVELIKMTDPVHPLNPGEQGTVTGVDDLGTIHVNWDCGSGLGLAYGEDECKNLCPDFTKAVRDGIMKVRNTALTNMFDVNAVQKIASDLECFETVIFIEEHREEYSNFILTGHV